MRLSWHESCYTRQIRIRYARALGQIAPSKTPSDLPRSSTRRLRSYRPSFPEGQAAAILRLKQLCCESVRPEWVTSLSKRTVSGSLKLFAQIDAISVRLRS